jgi:hypothetical protein
LPSKSSWRARPRALGGTMVERPAAGRECVLDNGRAKGIAVMGCVWDVCLDNAAILPR